MIDLSKYRIIDLSLEIVPGERRIDGRYLHGEPRWGRPLEVQEFIAYEARMHFIQGTDALRRPRREHVQVRQDVVRADDDFR